MRITRGRLLLIILLIVLLALAVFSLLYLLSSPKKPGAGSVARPSLFSVPLPEEVKEFFLQAEKPLKKPLGVTVSNNGEVFVADTGNDRIVVFSAAGKLLREFDGGSVPEAKFNYPVAVAIDEQRNLLYVADFNNSRVSAWSPRGEYRFSLPNDADLAEVGVIQPVALAVDESGKLYLSDVSRQRIVIFSAEGRYQQQFGSRGQEPGEFQFANGLAVDPVKKDIYVADTNNGRLQVFKPDGAFGRSQDRIEEKLLVTPRGLALDARRNLLYIADTVTHQVYIYQLRAGRGTYFGGLGTGRGQFSFPNGLAVDKEGRLYVTDRDNNRVVVYAYPEK